MESIPVDKCRKGPLSCRKRPCRLLWLLLLAVIAAGPLRAQSITLSVREASFESALRQVGAQAGHQLVYTHETVQKGKPVSLTLHRTPLRKALDRLFEDQPLTYLLQEGHIVVKAKEEKPAVTVTHDVSGTVTDETGVPLAGVTVSISGTARATATDAGGNFLLRAVDPGALLVFSSVGYQTRAIALNGQFTVQVQLAARVNTLDETVVIAYGTTTRRLSTGSVGKVNGSDIARQPVTNPLAALHGRVTGLTVTQSSGTPGASVAIQIRGRNSLLQGSEPLIIIDGVPFAPNNDNVNRLISMLSSESGAGLSAFNALQLSDIESIEVLKDADATAIYGSRGANGVILFTTRKGRAGKTAYSFSTQSGWSRMPSAIELLHTTDYLRMRREAFSNDGALPNNTPGSPAYAPDLTAWDTTRYTDFSKRMLGGTAHYLETKASVSGGTPQTQFIVNGTWGRETTVLPQTLANNRTGMHLHLNHGGAARRFGLQLSGTYTQAVNNLGGYNLVFESIHLPPNAPALYDTAGRLNWEEGGADFSNPLGYLERRYHAVTQNLVSHLQLSYRLMPGLQLRTALGYNTLRVNEQSTTPLAAQNPAHDPTGSLQVASNDYSSWIAEPQVEYTRTVRKVRGDFLVGSSLQQNKNTGLSIAATGYTNDALIGSLAAAPSIASRTNTFAHYRYAALFGRLRLNAANKYLLTASARRDGSSRFGPDRRWATFAAIGAGWLFSNEKLLARSSSFLSYGKLRGSYGTSGNDQIGNYRYLDLWNSIHPYQGGTALIPGSLYNPGYGWETNKKLEAALELGFFKDRLLLTAAWYRNRSDNQLVEYRLPSQTGFYGVTQNFNALVQNKGVELELSTTNLSGRHFTWTSRINLSFPQNTLVSFPGLSSSSYAFVYVEGEPINLVKGYRLTGVDPANGLYSFDDIDKDGALSPAKDYAVLGTTDPEYYGGLRNTFGWQGLQLDVFLEFRKQWGKTYLYSLYNSRVLPGTPSNQPAWVLQRWQAPGDEASLGRWTALTTSPAYAQRANVLTSSGVYGDASYLRLKTASLSYRLPPARLSRMHLDEGSVFVQGQNLLTLTRYKGADPETQNLYVLPPLRTLSFGLQITF